MVSLHDLMSEEELRKQAAIHRRAAEEYERQLAAREEARIPEEMTRLKSELSAAHRRISELEAIIERAKGVLGGDYFSDEDD